MMPDGQIVKTPLSLSLSLALSAAARKFPNTKGIKLSQLSLEGSARKKMKGRRLPDWLIFFVDLPAEAG